LKEIFVKQIGPTAKFPEPPDSATAQSGEQPAFDYWQMIH
jgi:hypothetical protein